ncbi:MAG: hypothetical protein WKF84_01400 [Pyrinomonadaceae bacterium]
MLIPIMVERRSGGKQQYWSHLTVVTANLWGETTFCLPLSSTENRMTLGNNFLPLSETHNQC